MRSNAASFLLFPKLRTVKCRGRTPFSSASHPSRVTKHRFRATVVDELCASSMHQFGKINFRKIPLAACISLITFPTSLYKYFTSVNHAFSVYIPVRASALALQQRRCCTDSPSCLRRLSFFPCRESRERFRRIPCFISQLPLLFLEKQRPRLSLFSEPSLHLFLASWLSAFSFPFPAR